MSLPCTGHQRPRPGMHARACTHTPRTLTHTPEGGVLPKAVDGHQRGAGAHRHLDKPAAALEHQVVGTRLGVQALEREIRREQGSANSTLKPISRPMAATTHADVPAGATLAAGAAAAAPCILAPPPWSPALTSVAPPTAIITLSPELSRLRQERLLTSRTPARWAQGEAGRGRPS